MSVPVGPLAPADAYYVMEEVLGEGYFLRRPPEHGVILEVQGADTGLTQWAMTAQEATQVIQTLRPDRRILSAVPTRY